SLYLCYPTLPPDLSHFLSHHALPPSQIYPLSLHDALPLSNAVSKSQTAVGGCADWGSTSTSMTASALSCPSLTSMRTWCMPGCTPGSVMLIIPFGLATTFRPPG